VDFGFIFGKNPKGKDRWSPEIKICKEMIDCMKVRNRYADFEELCI